MAARSRAPSTASSARPTASPGSRPMSKRSASSPPMPSASPRTAISARSRNSWSASAPANIWRRSSAAFPMSQGEIVRLADLGLAPSAVAARVTPAVERLIASGNTAPRRARLAELMRQQPGSDGRRPAASTRRSMSIRDEMRKFADGEVVPHAQRWHLRNHYIPLDIIAQMSELGVFSLTIPEDYGGMGLGKESMCVVSEELVARLYRRRQARHPLGDRRRAHPRQRHRGAETQMAAEDRLRRGAADGGVHRAEYRLRPCLAQDARGARTATPTRSTATRPGSRIRCAPT